MFESGAKCGDLLISDAFSHNDYDIMFGFKSFGSWKFYDGCIMIKIPDVAVAAVFPTDFIIDAGYFKTGW